MAGGLLECSDGDLMKDYTREQLLGADISKLNALDVVNNALEVLLLDQVHALEDIVAAHPITEEPLTYEELLGALLSAQADLRAARLAGFKPECLLGKHDEEAEEAGDWKDRFGDA